MTFQTTIWATLAVVFVAIIAAMWFSAQGGLKVTEGVVNWRYNVTELPVAELARLLEAAPDQLLLFDVRTPKEFAVSHLPGAQRLNPEMSAQKFLQQHADKITGRQLVFYCSVGVRSASLADRVAAKIASNENVKIRNLRGGIFRWAAQARPLVNAHSATNLVHPYNAVSAKLLPKQVSQSYVPAVGAAEESSTGNES